MVLSPLYLNLMYEPVPVYRFALFLEFNTLR